MPKVLISTVAFFAAIAIAGFLALPKYQEFAALSAEKNNLQLQFQERQEYFAKVARTYQDLQQEKALLDKIETALPTGSESGRLVYLLQELASQNGLIISRIDFSPVAAPTQGEAEQAPPRYKEVNVSLRLSGSYPALKNFLTVLERSARLIEVVSLDFSSQSEDAASLVNLVLKVRHY